MEIITTKVEGGSIIIDINIDGLVFASENNPEFKEMGLKVIDKESFALEVSDCIEATFYDQETGITKFQMFLDDVVEQVIASGDDSTVLNCC